METCSNCNVACLEPHPQFMWWLKCPICGFCKKNEDLSSGDKQLADKFPFCYTLEWISRKN
jgi:hypothetical protein